MGLGQYTIHDEFPGKLAPTHRELLRRTRDEKVDHNAHAEELSRAQIRIPARPPVQHNLFFIFFLPFHKLCSTTILLPQAVSLFSPSHGLSIFGRGRYRFSPHVNRVLWAYAEGAYCTKRTCSRHICPVGYLEREARSTTLNKRRYIRKARELYSKSSFTFFQFGWKRRNSTPVPGIVRGSKESWRLRQQPKTATVLLRRH